MKREIYELVFFIFIILPLINIFIFQSYAIPTGSMEGSMLVGDKLFVTKFNYGVKLPNTPVALPLMHNRIPGTNIKSYTDIIELPYMRLPGFDELNSGDICVFNWPVGDTMTVKYQSTRSYYSMMREKGRKSIESNYDLVTHPVDRKENYVKRCVAAAGDTLLLRDGDVYINGKPFQNHEEVQYSYIVQTNGTKISSKIIKKYDIRGTQKIGSGYYVMFLTEKEADVIQGLTNVENLTKNIISFENIGPEKQKGQTNNIYPHHPDYQWTRDNYGPLYMPKSGDRIELTEENYIFYNRVIRTYEDNPDFTWKNGQAYMNGKPVTHYTFGLSYYYMIGDNRHNSQDSRMWGFVPEDHITGKPWFVWLSTHSEVPFYKIFSKINWKKSFRFLS